MYPVCTGGGRHNTTMNLTWARIRSLRRLNRRVGQTNDVRRRMTTQLDLFQMWAGAAKEDHI